MADLEIDSGVRGSLGWRRMSGKERPAGEVVIRLETQTKHIGMTLDADREAELRQWLNERHSESLRPSARIRHADRS